MNRTIAKALRTLQSELPFSKGVKDGLYFRMRRLLSLPHERDFKALQDIHPPADRVLVDVGANQGQSIESISIYAPSSRIVSFEPNPGLARKLRARYKNDPRISIVAKGLGDHCGTSSLYVPSYKGFVYDGLASLRKNEASSWISERTVFGFNPARLKIEEVVCSVTTLDAEGLAPFFIKLDVQGYEYEVLRGGTETLRKFHPLLLVESFSSDARTKRLMDEFGYEEYNFDHGTIEKGSPSRSPNSFLMTWEMARALFAPRGLP